MRTTTTKVVRTRTRVRTHTPIPNRNAPFHPSNPASQPGQTPPTHHKSPSPPPASTNSATHPPSPLSQATNTRPAFAGSISVSTPSLRGLPKPSADGRRGHRRLATVIRRMRKVGTWMWASCYHRPRESSHLLVENRASRLSYPPGRYPSSGCAMQIRLFRLLVVGRSKWLLSIRVSKSRFCV
jgi:hypothetical protein